MKGVMNSKMGKGKRVRDHVLKMMNYLNEVEIQDAHIDDNLKIDWCENLCLKHSKNLRSIII